MPNNYSVSSVVAACDGVVESCVVTRGTGLGDVGDAGKEGESQYGDWRGIGILLANVDKFSISNHLVNI